MKKTLIAGISAIAMVASLVVAGLPAAQAALNVPKNAWPTCTLVRTTYCVESVSVTSANGSTVALTWLADGQNFPAADTSTVSTGVSDSSTVSDSTTVVTPVVTIPTLASGRAVAGRWTSEDWSTQGLDLLGYGGLYVEAKTANEFVNHLFINVIPTIADTANKVKVATQIDNNKYAANLDGDLTISVVVKTGEIKAGVLVGVGTNFTGDYSTASAQSTIRFSGSPVNVPLAAKSSDCDGEIGVAVASVRQLQAMLFINNDGQSAFGVDGLTGDMVVSSNGVCGLGTPVWNSVDKEFTWTAAAPHFAPDGTTLNYGFYRASIPVADAKLLWGLDNAADAVKALQVEIITGGTVTSVASTTIGVKSGKVIIDVSGFQYSRPKLKLSLKKSWKPAPPMLVKKTITCKLGMTVKKITALKPVCPKGYKKD
jgi:hypothetical protein